MAKYVEHCPDIFPQQERGVNVWWLPEEFSQSRLGDREIGSNACSLIAVLLSGRIDEFQLQIWGLMDQPLTRLLVTSIAEAIIEGNEIHETLIKSNLLPSLNLTVVEALRAVNHKYPFLVEWVDQTTLVMEPMGDTLADTLEKPFNAWTRSPPQNRKINSDLYGVLVGDDKTVVFVYQPQLAKITVIDGMLEFLVSCKCECGDKTFI